MYKSSYEGGLKLPELGKLDRGIYLTLIPVSVLSAVGATIAFFLLYEKVHFVSPEVIGFANRAGILGWMAVMVLMVLVTGALIGGFNREFPIFGAPGVTYGGPEWTQVYPLLMPTADAPEQVKRDVRQGRETIGFLLAGIVLAGALFGVSLQSGDRLHADGSVHVIWGFGWEVKEYQPENVEEVMVSLEAMGRRPRKYEVVLKYKMDDDRVYEFCVREFRDDGETSPIALLVKALSCYPDADIDFINGGRMPDLVCDQQYNEEEERLLIELFSRD